MLVLVINCGSSSVKAAVVEHQSGARVGSLKVERVGEPAPRLSLDGLPEEPCPAATDHNQALRVALPPLLARLGGGATLAAVGHRVVHGGTRFSQPARIDDSVIQAIEEVSDLAPLHNPPNLAGVRAARELLPAVPQVAVFDTAFHATLPRRSRLYALPQELAERHGIRRFGFHGISHAYVAQRAADYLGEDLRRLRLITCHLGNGCSVAAVEYGRSIDTSMGLTPLEGLVMGTRVGDVDPGVLLHLMRRAGLSPEALDQLLNRQAGLAALSGVGNDMRDLERRAAEGDDRCRLAIQVFAHRVRKYLGAYAAVMDGVEAIIFTAGIGENSVAIRHRVAQRLDFLGARLDEDRNRDARVDRKRPVFEISDPRGRVRLLVVATDEEHAIAQETAKTVLGLDRPHSEQTIPVAISARHVHLTPASIETLFGTGHQLTVRNPLSQPGQYAAEETVTVVGPRRALEKVRVLGPPRGQDQVEISRTDEFFLGLDAPVRCSGDLASTPGCSLIGPAGRLDLPAGVICAKRHIHMGPADAERFGVRDHDLVEVGVETEGRDLVFGDVVIRVSPEFRLEMHLDTDEGNAAELAQGAAGVLVATPGRAHLARRETRFDRAD